MTLRYRELPFIQPIDANSRPDYEVEGSYLHTLLLEQGACSQDARAGRIHQEFIEKSAFGRKSKEKMAALETAAKAICNMCIVKEECLEFALPGYEAYPYAIMGGLNPSELAAEAERRKIMPIKKPRQRVSRAIDVE